jgi:hypothetical protein
MQSPNLNRRKKQAKKQTTKVHRKEKVMEFKFKVNGKEYDFKYDNLVFDISSQDFAADIISVTCDGKEKDNYFGVSFVGYSYTAEDALCASIVAYVNNDTSYDFIEIPSEIKKIRSGFFKKQLTTNGRDIPKQILTPELEVGDVKMITKEGQAAYLDDYGSVTVLTYPDWSVATDMENFFIEGTIDLYQEKEIVFIDPEFEESLKEYVDESARVKTVVNKILEGTSVRQALSENWLDGPGYDAWKTTPPDDYYDEDDECYDVIVTFEARLDYPDRETLKKYPVKQLAQDLNDYTYVPFIDYSKIKVTDSPEADEGDKRVFVEIPAVSGNLTDTSGLVTDSEADSWIADFERSIDDFEETLKERHNITADFIYNCEKDEI